MIFVRRRLLVWLIKAYIKKWGKAFALFFFIGLLVFFVLIKFSAYVVPKISIGQKESIGIVGAYTLDTLPENILSDISRGLTSLSEDGSVRANLAKSWKITNGDKTYIFILNNNLYFSDGTFLTSDQIVMPYSDIVVTRPNANSISVTLKDPYSPFLVTVSRPLFKNGFIGIGDYKIKDVKVNGNFIESLTLVLAKNQYVVKSYHFYPSENALKMAFVLGEITKAEGLSDMTFRTQSFYDFKNANIKKYVNNHRLVTLFYNTRDAILGDEKIRSGLSYALPDTFSRGERNYAPYSLLSWAYSETYAERKQDLVHANRLITASKTATTSAEIALTIKTLEKYKTDAEIIANAWKKVGFKTNIETVTQVPDSFQIFLGDFTVPNDPDQYTLWHTDQQNNITHYSSLRIDKLLEDGRKINDIDKRRKIYADFQKYLLADSPAAFLYLPYEYELVRK